MAERIARVIQEQAERVDGQGDGLTRPPGRFPVAIFWEAFFSEIGAK